MSDATPSSHHPEAQLGQKGPRVVVSAHGRFWLFDLARFLLRNGHLQRLFTATPRFRVDRDLRPFTSTRGWLMPPLVALYRTGFHSLIQPLNLALFVDFDRFVARHLTDGDVFMGLDGGALETQRIAHQRGMLVVSDRGSTHPVYRERILKDEYARFNCRYKGTDARITARMLAEYSNADLITVPSHFAAKTFIEEGVPAWKIRVVPYGVDLSLFRPLAKRDSVFRVLFVGSKGFRKGLPYLLEAVAGLRLPNFETVLVGGVEEPGIHDVLARYRDHFRDRGIISRNELAVEYSQASVLVLPSLEEGLALVQAQAMACGIPVIATLNTGAADLFTDGVEGFVVPTRDVSALRDRILCLYESEEAQRRMAGAALEQVKALGGWDTYGCQMMQVYAGVS